MPQAARDDLAGRLERIGERAIARLAPERLYWPLLRRYRSALYRGRRVHCPCCGRSYRRFRDDWNRADAICWFCGSHERHRWLWLYLERHTDLFLGSRPLAVLHVAPEHFLAVRLRRTPGVEYVSADLDAKAAMVRADITALPFADARFDAIVCSHVLEHVEDDRAAMRELFRVLRPGGRAFVMVPLDHERAHTYEDPAIVSPAERERAYWQADHLRLYGRDFETRLRDAGFSVSVARAAELPAPTLARHRLLPQDDVYVCERPLPA